jgi:hypothetical protein
VIKYDMMIQCSFPLSSLINVRRENRNYTKTQNYYGAKNYAIVVSGGGVVSYFVVLSTY